MELQDYLNTLPKKRVASGALIFNDDNKILFVEPTYKTNWEIPGGGVETNESPEQAVRRELLEELGSKVIALTLLHIEYQLQEHDDVFHFIYEATINFDLISLNKEELKSYHFFDLEEAKHMLLPRLFQRISYAVKARERNQLLYRETSV